MRVAVVVLAVGCGRVGFDARSDARDDNTASDATDSGIDGAAPLGPFGAFGAAVEQTGCNSTVREYGSSISGDGLEIYWSTYNTPTVGGSDVWTSTRIDRASQFSTPVHITAIGSVGDDGEPTISHDGRTLYFNRYNPVRQLWVSTRPTPSGTSWSTPVPLESPAANLAGFEGADFGPDDLRLVVYKFGETTFYESTRPDASSPWGVPHALVGVGGMSGDSVPAVRSDGLELFWESNRAPPLAIYHAFRPSLDQPFGASERLSFGVPLDGSGVGDPDISDDGRTLVFVAIPDAGEFDIYLAERAPL